MDPRAEADTLGGVWGLSGPDAAAAFDPSTGSLRVLKGSTMFVVTVPGRGARSIAVALAEKALSRLGEEPGPDPVQ